MTQKDNQNKSKIFMLQEMHDSMLKSIDNAKHVYEQQAALVELVKSNDKTGMFKEFVTEMEEQLKKMQANIDTLLYRANRLEFCLKQVEGEDIRARIAIDALIEALGLFRE